MAKEFVQLLYGELVEAHDFGLRPESGRQNVSGILLGRYVHNYPRLMFPILAAPVAMRQEMGAGLEKDFGAARTCYLFRFVWNLNEKSTHWTRSPFYAL